MVDIYKKIRILFVGSNADFDCRSLVKIIQTQNPIYEVELVECLEDVREKVELHFYAIVIFDLKFCNFEEVIRLSTEIRQHDENCILVVLVHNTCDTLLDLRLIDIPVDDFIRSPFILEFFKEKIFLWSIRYKRRVLNYIETTERMRNYEEGLQTLKDLEGKLKSFLVEK